MAESVGSERRLPNPHADSGAGALLRRIISAVVLIPVALAALWFGAPWLTLLVAIAAGLMSWEWVALIGRHRLDALTAGGMVTVVILLASLYTLLAGLILAGTLLLILEFLGRRGKVPAAWTIGGLVWIILPSIGFLWLRDRPVHGLSTTAWLLALVWAVDIAAYIVGRTIGGPRLVPRISPKKTWSGLLGGLAAAAAIGAVTALLTGSARWWQIALFSAALGIVEQIGDIAESYAKRKFGAKDSSTLIPGHGGLLDRLDGMLAVVAVVTLISLAAGDVLSWN